MREQPTTTVAILGASTLVEGILARLLEEEGYDLRHLEVHPTGLVEGPIEGVDVVLLAPGLKDRVREPFLETMRSTQRTAAMPVLTLPDALKVALLDELSADTTWRGLFEELVGQIGAALASAAESAKVLVVEGAQPPSPSPQADAL